MPSSDEVYETIAQVYDQPDHTIIARAFHRRLKRHLAKLSPGSVVLDMGCGTGALTELLAIEGFYVVGIDRSEKMLEIARRRCARLAPRIRFLHQDLAAPIPRDLGCRAAVACGDVVNHVSSIERLTAVFSRAEDALDPGGFLAFDCLNRWCFETYWSAKTYYMEAPRGELVMRCTWDPARHTGAARMISYTCSDNGFRVRSETTLFEYLYSEAELRGALRSAGFPTVRATPWSPWPDQHLEPQQDRLFCIAAPRRQRPR